MGMVQNFNFKFSCKSTHKMGRTNVTILKIVK